MNEYELKLVKGALAALSQKSTFPADVVYAKKLLKELVAAQHRVQADKSKLSHVGNPCIHCGISQNIPGAVSGVCSCR